MFVVTTESKCIYAYVQCLCTVARRERRDPEEHSCKPMDPQAAATFFPPWPKKQSRVSVISCNLLLWDLVTASIVSNDNGAGWPQTSVNCWELVVFTTTNIATTTAKFVIIYIRNWAELASFDKWKNMYLGNGIIWVQFPGSLLPHLDIGQ